jgi:hypothetical protein
MNRSLRVKKIGNLPFGGKRGRRNFVIELAKPLYRDAELASRFRFWLAVAQTFDLACRIVADELRAHGGRKLGEICSLRWS